MRLMHGPHAFFDLVMKGIGLYLHGNTKKRSKGFVRYMNERDMKKTRKDDLGQLLLSEDGAGRQVLHHAALHGKEAVIRYVIKQGAPVAACDHEGNRPLHLAVWAGHVGSARILLENGASVFAVNNDGETALDIARKQAFKDIETLLENAGKPYAIVWGGFEHSLHVKGPFGP
ncbi:MAG: hypothetical protein A2018_06375 [Alphaproteobacteria bacterium GWF2_58_20]|nr:MAG: hypothetical protein A2018_06375 [Alphaproteobacteria bacterium GWF2_58_20]